MFGWWPTDEAKLAEKRRKDRAANPVKIGELYLHVSNGGWCITVRDQGFGPTLEVETMHFGNCKSKIKVHTSLEGLRQIRDLLDKALQYSDYTPAYCHAAEPSFSGDPLYACGQPTPEEKAADVSSDDVLKGEAS